MEFLMNFESESQALEQPYVSQMSSNRRHYEIDDRLEDNKEDY